MIPDPTTLLEDLYYSRDCPVCGSCFVCISLENNGGPNYRKRCRKADHSITIYQYYFLYDLYIDLIDGGEYVAKISSTKNISILNVTGSVNHNIEWFDHDYSDLQALKERFLKLPIMKRVIYGFME